LMCADEFGLLYFVFNLHLCTLKKVNHKVH
jgi:hypothetical protein